VSGGAKQENCKQKAKQALKSHLNCCMVAFFERMKQKQYIGVGISVDQDPRSGAFLAPGSGMGKKSGPGSRMKNPDHISSFLVTIFWVKIFLIL
jgi:hypothetical protein